MTRETFLDALRWTAEVEHEAWSFGAPRLILISGGEPTEHPEIEGFIDVVIREKLVPLLITNGMFLKDERLKAALLMRPRWASLRIQITNDARYYPASPPRIDDPRITWVESLDRMVPLGRFKRDAETKKLGEVMKQAPSSFNLRSLTRSLKDFSKAVSMLRMRAMQGMSGHCTPSVTHEGDVLVGESRSCWKVGTVTSTNAELTRATLAMGSCNRCGLESGLSPAHKRAIGASSLFGPDE